MYDCSNHLDCSKNYTLYSNDQDLKFVICDDCRLIWREKNSEHISKPYEKEYFNSKKYDSRRKHKVKKSGWLIDLAGLHHKNLISLLEVGCSICYTLEAAQKRELRHLGIDISNYAVKYCNKLGLNARNQSLAELRESSDRFDLVFMQHVLEHFLNPFEILKDCHTLLNKDGLILIMVPNSDYRRAEKHRENHRFYNKKGVGAEHFVYFNYKNLERALISTGFVVLQKDYPVFTGKYFNFTFFINRFVRRLSSLIKSNQEILVIAKKAA